MNIKGLTEYKAGNFTDFYFFFCIISNPLFWIFAIVYLLIVLLKKTIIPDLYYLWFVLPKYSNNELERFLYLEGESIKLGHFRKRTRLRRWVSEMAHKKANSIIQDSEEGHSFCEEDGYKCTMNYCDENGCLKRKRNLKDNEFESDEPIKKF